MKWHHYLFFSFIIILAGCPYISNKEFDAGRRIADQRIVGNWTLVKLSWKDSVYSNAIAAHQIANIANKQYCLHAIDSNSNVLPDFGFATIWRYRDANFISIQVKSAFNKQDSLYAYYSYIFSEDTLVVKEVSQNRMPKDKASFEHFNASKKEVQSANFFGEAFYFLKK